MQSNSQKDQEIQQLKNKLKKLETDNYLLTDAINHLPLSIYWKDREGVYLGCNQYVADMAGLASREDIIGKTDEDLPWATYPRKFKEIDRKIINQESTEEIAEEPALLKNGSRIVMLSTKAPIYDNQRNVIGLLGISFDITDRKKMEKELTLSKEKAEAANRAKTEFLANMSHDMKTPLAGIVTSADVIAYDQNAPERDRQFASIISASGKQLESFFTSCLDLSKMEMQEWASNTVTFSIRKLVDDVRTLFLPKAMSGNLELQVEYDESLPKTVEGHRDSLYRVLLNLVGNAIKFTERGSVTLRAKMLKNAEDKRVNVEFQVQDTGMGIPEDKHKVIFEKLRRLKPSYESKIEGSGIGLYIVDQYVKRMGGEIRVDSKVGEGSTFTVTLPLKIVANEAVESFIARPDVGVTKIQHDTISKKISNDMAAKNVCDMQDSPRVLVVEDTEVIQFVTKSLFNTAGFFVDIASTGEEAVEMFEPGKYGLIYMDIGLPKMNGYETAQAIRAKEITLKAQEQVPIIALTGHGAVDVQAFCGEAGMQGVLSKPLSREQAEMVWKHFKIDANISIPGLTFLTNAKPAPSDNEILDIDATIQTVGFKDIALNLMVTFIDDLKNQFLPQIKVFISEHKDDELRFLLHRQLGSLAYVKAPSLEKKLSEVQAMAHKGIHIDESVYQDIEQEVLRVLDGYQKMNLETPPKVA